MCGRFAQCSDPDALAQAFGLETVELELSPRYNLAPIQPVLAVRLHPPAHPRLARHAPSPSVF
jgi:putative SOS response-associated peptidase YedK